MRVIFEYANRLNLRGHDVVFYYPLKSYSFYKKGLFSELKDLIKMISKYFRSNKDFKIYEHSFKIISVPFVNNLFVRDADLTIATTWPTAYSLDKLSKKKGGKVYFIQDYEIWNSDIKMADRTFQFDFKRITISNYNREYFRKKFNIESKVILNGINFAIYDCLNKNFNTFKTIAFMDHPLESKGVSDAIKVVKRLKEKYSNLNFVAFGHKRFHNIPEFVKFYEDPDDITVAKEIYGKADIFLYTSLYEGFALPPAEAMACKCAVVTTTVGAVPEYSKHMETAIHAEPGNIDELFNGVCHLLNDEKEILRISENAYRYVRQKLDWNESVTQFEDCISMVS